MSDDVEILYQYATATTWPTADIDWTSDRAVRILDASDASAQAAGDARGIRRFGRVQQPYETSPSDNPLPTSHPSLGRYTRLLRADAGGTISAFSTTWTAFWWGFCGGIRTRYLGKQTGLAHTGLATYRLIGLAGLLESIAVIDGYDGNPSAAHPWNIFHAPTFNEGGKGNRETATWSLNGRSVYVFGLYKLGSTAASWTIAQALDYLLAAFTWRHGGGGTWTFLDSSTLGAEKLPPTPVHGKTLLQVINEIANPRRGLTWKIDIGAGNRPRLVLLDWKPAVGTAVDASGRDWQCEIDEDTTTACDHAIVVSQRAPVTTLTLDYKTTGSPRLAADGWSFGTPPADDPNSLILRRFKIATSILDEMRVNLVKDGVGYNGDRTTAADIGGGPAARGAELERMTGLAADQKDPTVALLADNDERSKARFFVKGTTAASWEDWSAKVSIEVSNAPTRITLHASDSDLLDLFQILNAGGEMRVTIGVRELAEARLSIDVGEYYRGSREILRQVGDIDEHTVASGTAIAVSAGSLVTASATVQTWDGVGLPLVDELVRLADARQRGRQVKVSLSKKGLDWTTLPPGSMISTLDGGPGAIQVDAGVTRRAWDFVNRTTSWDTIQLAEAVE